MTSSPTSLLLLDFNLLSTTSVNDAKVSRELLGTPPEATPPTTAAIITGRHSSGAMGGGLTNERFSGGVSKRTSA